MERVKLPSNWLTTYTWTSANIYSLISLSFSETKDFVNILFEALRTKSYLGPNDATTNGEVPPPVESSDIVTSNVVPKKEVSIASIASSVVATKVAMVSVF